MWWDGLHNIARQNTETETLFFREQSTYDVPILTVGTLRVSDESLQIPTAIFVVLAANFAASNAGAPEIAGSAT